MLSNTNSNAERIQNIKSTLTGMRLTLLEFRVSPLIAEAIYEDMRFLVKQAENTQKLVELYNDQGTALSNRSHENHWLKQELLRLQEELSSFKDNE